MVNRFIKELSRSMSCQLPAQLPAICCQADPFYRDSRPAETQIPNRTSLYIQRMLLKRVKLNVRVRF